MNEIHLFQIGDQVMVMNEEDTLFSQVGSICAQGFMGKKYLVAFDNGEKQYYDAMEITHWINSTNELKLYKAQLLQLQSLAVDLGDKNWFEEIGKVLKQLENTLIHST